MLNIHYPLIDWHVTPNLDDVSCVSDVARVVSLIPVGALRFSVVLILLIAQEVNTSAAVLVLEEAVDHDLWLCA